MQAQIRQIITDIYCDLSAACDEVGETLDAEGLADAVGDRMHDESEEYRSMPYEKRRAIVLRIAREYV